MTPTWLLGIIAALMGAIAIEAIVSGVRRLHLYRLRDSLANVVIYGVFFAILAVWTPVAWMIHDVVFGHAIFDLTPDGPLGHWWPAAPWILLIVAEDLCFYAFHRASHRIPLLWAAHQVHHSTRSYNLSVALRQSWLPILAIPFWLPLSFLGFDPIAVLTVQSVSLGFQAFLHTELIPSFGPLDAILNSPRHHRVHHGRAEEFVDRNFGGVFIVWDRLFRSFAKGVPRTYGMDEEPPPRPWTIELGPWLKLGRDVIKARSPLAIFRTLFGGTPETQSQGNP
jgi:sterol desaturase/sphingolipid hydroxylase (fatty acid hydroxylase superfamily)